MCTILPIVQHCFLRREKKERFKIAVRLNCLTAVKLPQIGFSRVTIVASCEAVVFSPPHRYQSNAVCPIVWFLLQKNTMWTCSCLAL